MKPYFPYHGSMQRAEKRPTNAVGLAVRLM